MLLFFVKHKTAYEMRISDWSSDVCASDRAVAHPQISDRRRAQRQHRRLSRHGPDDNQHTRPGADHRVRPRQLQPEPADSRAHPPADQKSEEHTSELQSLMRISYAVFCLKKKKKKTQHTKKHNTQIIQITQNN